MHGADPEKVADVIMQESIGSTSKEVHLGTRIVG
jgi:hypothetical protein